MILRKQLRYTNARCVIYITGGKTRNKANRWGLHLGLITRCASVYHPCRYLSSRCYLAR